MKPLEEMHVCVRDMRIPADIGVFAHEIGRAQPLVVSVRLALLVVTEDQLTETIDYNRIVDAALALGQQRIALIETFARRLAGICLAWPGVLEAEVTVEKPGALINGVAATRSVLRHG